MNAGDFRSPAKRGEKWELMAKNQAPGESIKKDDKSPAIVGAIETGGQMNKQIFKNLGNKGVEHLADFEPLTKGEDRRPATINDIIAIKNEVILASKLTGKNTNRIEKIYTNLLIDLKTGMFTGRWSLTQNEFSGLSPLLKPYFNNATKGNLSALLKQTRYAIRGVSATNNRYFKHRKGRFNSRKSPGQIVRCTAKDRLTPLSSMFYGAYLMPIATKRLGVVALKSTTYSNTVKEFYGDRCLTPLIDTGKICFMIKGNIVERGTWHEFVESRNINNGSKLNNLRFNEEALTNKRPLFLKQ